ncbi:mechanosensitive ion channel domain-containing protein [Lignipirellula cremea]|uniref:Miniconductance mechanosensitive channel MscM n=1 Tax=Lignipirellula cremea TaxID=2528010 RepID=A0A518DTL7_9BACT|nr:mechanosensitive ion channel domain-containing protein [Lignipirellula cremea]QDU95148.1 Miniconductance mechanosensitive channel MscM precursor [Lignipirellula cremea]
MRRTSAATCRLLAALFVVASVAILGSGSLSAQPPTPALPQELPPTRDEIEQAQQRLQNDTQVVEEDRVRLNEAYQKTLEFLKSRQDWQARADAFKSAAENAPKTIEETQKKLDSADVPLDFSQLDRAAQQQMLLEQEAALRVKEEEIAKREAAPKAEDRLNTVIPERLLAITQRQAEITAILADPPGDTPASLAKRKSLLAEKAALQAEADTLAAERQTFGATAELRALERRLATREVQRLTHNVKLLREAIDAARLKQAALEAKAAADLAAAVQGRILRAYAEQNSELASRRETLATTLKELNEQIEVTDAELRQIRTDFERIEKRLTQSGVNTAMGLVLQKQRASLGAPQAYRNSIRARQQLMGQLQVETYNLEELESEIPQFAAAAQAAANSASLEAGADELALQQAVETLVANRQDYIGQLQQDNDLYFRRLVELDTLETDLLRLTQNFEAFIKEQVLWVPNRQPINRDDLGRVWLAVSRRLTPHRLAQEWKSLSQVIWAHWGWLLAAMLLVGSIFFVERRIKARLDGINQMLDEDKNYSFTPTLQCIFFTLLGAALWPGVLLLLGNMLSSSKSATTLWLAAGESLYQTSLLLFALDAIRKTCRRGGLAIAHFGWEQASVLRFHHRIRWVLWMAVPLTFAILMLRNDLVSLEKAAVARVLFLIGMVALLIGLPLLASPFSRVVRDALGQSSQSWFARMYYVWLAITAAIPATLAILTAMGYSYTASQMAGRIFGAFCVLYGVMCAHAAVVRWLVLARRRLAIVEAEEQARHAAATLENAPSELAESALSHVEVVNPEDIDLTAIDAEQRGLVRNVTLMAVVVLMWILWNDVLPALRFVETISLWKGADGVAINLGNAALAAITIAVTFMVTKTAPSLLETTVLHRMPLDPGARFAITTISRYLFSIMGAVIACHQIGFSWFNVQWFIAAVTVGLGFGLQEIFANFVSGLILLLERPIRVGDVVTVGETTGVVVRIRMRATTIRDWDRKELIVPNKEFITGRLLNWTLSDSTNRLVIEVGVSYSTDVEYARLVLLRVLRRHPEVLKDPSPTVVFDGFMDSSLRMVARLFLENLENRLTVTHELHAQILRAFRDAKIDIPFPQRDLHIRSTVERAQLAGDGNTSKAG